MRHYKASELKGKDGGHSGKWHYTCTFSDGHCFPIGYCSNTDECSGCEAGNGGNRCNENGNWEKCPECGGKGFKPKENPCPGHDTPEGAAAHYRQYQIDHARFAKNEDQQHKCKVCGEWSQHYAIVGGYGCYDLCEAHANKEGLAQIYPDVDESWQS